MSSVLNDPRDVPQLRLIQQTTLVFAAACALFYVGRFSWWFAALYWAVWGSVFGDRVTTMLHTFIHRPLFRKPYRWLNAYVNWIVAPLFGQSPYSFYVHHVGMHHPEGNLGDDLSSTMSYQRDRFSHFMRYYLRFAVFGTAQLIAYHLRHRHRKLVAYHLAGKLYVWGVFAALAAWRWQPTVVVCIVPYVLTHFMLMAGNFGQHSLIDPDAPDNDYRNSITTVWTRYNTRCFNDGYHAFHHVRPTAHYAELREDFEQHREKYGEADAIVVDGIDFVGVWFLLMTGQHAAIARRIVPLPGAPTRTTEEWVALLARRVTPIRNWAPARRQEV
jgi:hypothetical protein